MWFTKATLPAHSAHPKQTVWFHCVQAQTVKLTLESRSCGARSEGHRTWLRRTVRRRTEQPATTLRRRPRRRAVCRQLWKARRLENSNPQTRRAVLVLRRVDQTDMHDDATPLVTPGGQALYDLRARSTAAKERNGISLPVR